MTRAVAFLVVAALFTACSSNSAAPSASSNSSAPEALANLDSVTWPSTRADVLALYRRMPAKIGDHDLVQFGMSSLGATYGSPNPGKADVMTYAMTTEEAGIQTPAADRLGELRRMLSDAPNAKEEASSAGGGDASAYLAMVAPMNPNRPADVRHMIYWIPPDQSWMYVVGAKDTDDRDAALTAMIEAAAASGSTVIPPVAPLGLDSVRWPTDAGAAKEMLATMPATVAGLAKGPVRNGSVAYGDGVRGSEPIQVMISPVPSDHTIDIAQMPAVMIGMGYPVKKVESGNDDPKTPLAWFEAEVGPPAPGMTGGYAISWAPTDGAVVYAVIAQTAELRSATVEAMAASIPA